MKNRAVGLILLGMFIALFIAMHAVALESFGSIFTSERLLLDASPLLTLVAACFLGAGLYYFFKPDNEKSP